MMKSAAKVQKNADTGKFLRKIMRFLCIFLYKCKGLWDFFEQEKLSGIDIIISCGDLPPQYLSFLATYFKGPVLYVHGNHDECYDKTPPDGCICIDGKVFNFNGIKIAGLGGSMEYSKGTYQFTEWNMNKRVKKLKRKLLLRTLKKKMPFRFSST